PLDRLRSVLSERRAGVDFDPTESVIAAGEQVRKRRTLLATNVVQWQDFFDGRQVAFASFVPPGRYAVSQPRSNQYCRMDEFDHAIWREIRSPASGEAPLAELELVFKSR